MSELAASAADQPGCRNPRGAGEYRVPDRPGQTAAWDSRRKKLGGNVAETYNGYCVKCKEKRDFQGEVVTSDSGRRMAKGSCPVCGTKMNRILGKA